MKEADLERKLRIERLERCMNCTIFWNCEETKDLIEICDHFKEEPISRQMIVVGLVRFTDLETCARKCVSQSRNCT